MLLLAEMLYIISVCHWHLKKVIALRGLRAKGIAQHHNSRGVLPTLFLPQPCLNMGNLADWVSEEHAQCGISSFQNPKRAPHLCPFLHNEKHKVQ